MKAGRISSEMIFVVTADNRLSDPAKVTFLVLAGLLTQSPDGVPVRMIGESRDINRATVHRHLKALEQFGYLTRTHQFYDDGAQGHSLYSLAGMATR